MNGVRSTFQRRGYLLTALSAAVLLAASPGTAFAQNTSGVTITGPPMNTVGEGGTATYTVAVRGYVAAATDANNPVAADSVEVSLDAPTGAAADGATAGEAADLNTNASKLVVNIPTPANANTNPRLFTGSASITVVTLDDDDAEDERYTLTFNLDDAGGLGQGAADTTAITLLTGAATHPAALIIDDNETQTYVLTVTSTGTPTEGAAATVTGTAVPAHTAAPGGSSSGELQLETDPDDGYTLGAETLTIGAAPVTVTVTQDAGDGNRVADTVTLSAYRENTGRGADMLVASVPITFADANALPTVAVTVTTDATGATPTDPQPTSVEEGGSVFVIARTLGADGMPAPFAEQLTVKLRASASGTADARDIVAPDDLTIATDNTGGAVALAIFGPDDDVGSEELVLDAVVSGTADIGTETSTSSGVLTLTITDKTDRKIWALPEDEAYPKIEDAIDDGDGDDDKLNPYPQESFTVDASGLFGMATGYTATYAAAGDGAAVSVSQAGSMVTVTAEEDGAAKVTITGTAVMAADSFMSDQSVSNAASITFEVMVEDSELVVAVAAVPDAIDEGGTSEITATANRMVTAADGAVAIDLLVVGEATLDSDSIMIAMGEMSGSAMLTAAADEDADDETVTVIASGSGIDDNMSIEIAVNDTTEVPEPTNAIEAKPQDEAYPIITDAIDAGAGDEGLNPGESAMVDAAELFTVMEGYTATFAASVEGDAVDATVSGSHVSLSADALGDAKVTITGTATAASSSFEAGQPATNVATVTFPVTVVDKMLTLTLDAPGVMDGNVVEGMGYDITVTANRQVHGDTEVTFMRSDMSEADVRDYSIDPVTIMAGETMATARLIVEEDMEPDAGHAMGEALHLYGMAGDVKSNTLELTIWDEAVPALPLIGQLVLALFLALGGARLYRRRQG